jgi:hypothetical protein
LSSDGVGVVEVGVHPSREIAGTVFYMKDTLLIRGIADLFRHVQWNIGIAYEPISGFLRPRDKPIIHWLPSSDDRCYLADPFVIVRNQRRYLFCEEFDYAVSKGRIVMAEMNDSKISELRPVIELPIHISYPYLLQENGELYCVPETHQAGEIGLYRITEFPNVWKKVSILVSNFPGRDSTLFRHQGRWWLTSADADYRLFVWYATTVFGPWIPHSLNPVKSDVGSSRPAGTPFFHDHYLYRPAQDCSRTYGGRIVLNKILRLTPREFEEEAATFIEPDQNGPYPEGLHTISASGDITFLDGKRKRFVKSAFKKALTVDIQRLAMIAQKS